MRCLSLCLLVFLCHFAHAEDNRNFQRPDYKQIKRAIEDDASPWYYPTLLRRFQEGDTGLTARDYHMLYYGYFFNAGYNAYGTISPYTDSIMVLNKKHVWAQEDKENFLRYNLELLKMAPLQLSTLAHVFVAYRELQDDANAEVYRRKCRMLIGAILASGDGLTCATGYHVLSVPDEYEVLSYEGYTFGGEQRLTNDRCDMLKVAENDKHIGGLYFDVKQLLKKYEEQLSQPANGKSRK